MFEKIPDVTQKKNDQGAHNVEPARESVCNQKRNEKIAASWMDHMKQWIEKIPNPSERAKHFSKIILLTGAFTVPAGALA